MHRPPFRLLRFRNQIELELLLSLFLNRLRTVLAVQGPLRRAQTARPGPLRAVLKKPFLIRGKGELGNLMTRHLNISPFHSQTTHALLRLEAPAQRQRGWMPKLFAASSSRGSFFSLHPFL